MHYREKNNIQSSLLADFQLMQMNIKITDPE